MKEKKIKSIAKEVINDEINALIKLKPILTTIHISGGDEMQKVTSNLKRNKH